MRLRQGLRGGRCIGLAGAVWLTVLICTVNQASIAGAEAAAPARQEEPATAARAGTLALQATGLWRCTPGQDCSRNPDYIAYVVNSAQGNLYLSFGGQLGAPLVPANLQRHFRYLDLYIPTQSGGTRTWKLVSISAGQPLSGSVTFESVDATSMRLRVQAAGYKQRVEQRGPNVVCPGSESRGLCITEQRIETPLNLSLVVPLSPFLPASSRAALLPGRRVQGGV